MDELRRSFPMIPDIVLLQCLTTTGLDVNLTKQVLRRMLDRGVDNMVQQPIFHLPLPMPLPMHNIPQKRAEANIPNEVPGAMINNMNIIRGIQQPFRMIAVQNMGQRLAFGPNNAINRNDIIRRFPFGIIHPGGERLNLLEGGQFRNELVNRQPDPSLNLETKTCNILGLEIKIPMLPDKIIDLVGKAIRLSPEIDFTKGSSFLELVIKTDKYPDDIVDRLVMACMDSTLPRTSIYERESLYILYSMFPQISKCNIKTLFTGYGKKISGVIEAINGATNMNVLKKVRKVGKIVEVRDLVVAYFIHMFEQNEIAKKEREEKAALEAMELEEASINGSLIECSCCFTDVPFSKCMQCPEGHLFCKNCVIKMIETSISEGRSSVKCPAMGDCNLDIPMSELERAIPAKILERLFQTETMNSIIKSGINNIVKCSECGFFVEFIGNGNMRCPQCQTETCSSCGLRRHDDKSCDEAKTENSEQNIEERMNDAIIRSCPKCKTPFTKDEGCNKMVCPRCETWICYWCRKVIPKEVGYNHFWRERSPCPPDICPLWVESKQLHIIEAQKAKLKAKDEF